jgi:nitrogenase-associated protein
MKIVFWEKPGCMGNARQRALLVAGGHDVQARSLPDHAWTREELLGFLEGLAVPDWFNTGAGRIKSGEIVPGDLNAEEAIALLVGDPILVRRPLLEIGQARRAGWDLEWIEACAGPLSESDRIRRVRSEDLSACPGDSGGRRCGDPHPEI